MKTIEIEPTFESWQAAARTLLRDGTPPAQVRWRETPQARQASLDTEPAAPGTVKVPRQFVELARQAAAAPDPARWQILYDTLWRLVHDDHDLLKNSHDPGVRRLHALVAPKDDKASGEADVEGAAPFVPPGLGLAELKAAAAHCKGCDLYRHATQTVFGRGSAHARIVFIGEQPGDQEDLQGAPFVGPAGEVFECVADLIRRLHFGWAGAQEAPQVGEVFDRNSVDPQSRSGAGPLIVGDLDILHLPAQDLTDRLGDLFVSDPTGH